MTIRPIHQALLAASLVSASVLAAQSVLAQEGEPAVESMAGMFSQGEVGFKFRYRYEMVDDDNFNRDAKASTLLSRMTFTSASYRGFSFLGEFDNVSFVGDDKFNSTANGKVQYPVVADPKGTEVNQAWLKYAQGDLAGIYGRQRIVHGNQRFVGGVAWRQNEQTYDGFRALWDTEAALKLDYSYIYNVNRIFGPDDSVAQPADWNGNLHLARLDFKLFENHALAGYAYLLDIDERGRWNPNKSVNNSSDTYGIEYSGKFGPMTARAAWATQSDAGDSYLKYDADYLLLEGGLAFMGMTATLGYEVLGAGDGVGFKTPLATLHKFQGWADKFLLTPGDGIEDLYLGLTGKLGSVSLGGSYHEFQAEDSGADFGSELDLVATWPVNKWWNLQFKYANFFTDDASRYSDTQKAWLTVNFKI